MASKKFPYYPMYVDDFDDDPNVIAMDAREVGVYILSLNRSWKLNGIPDDPAQLAVLIRKKPADVRKAWPKVRACFVESGRPGVLVNPRQEIERLKVCAKSEKASESARVRYERSAFAVRSQCVGTALAPRHAYGSGSVSGSSSPGGGVGEEPDTPGVRYALYDVLLAGWPADDKREVDLGAQIWMTLVAAGEVLEFQEVMDGLERWKNSEQWQKDGGKYRPSIAKWLQKRAWKDFPKQADGW